VAIAAEAKATANAGKSRDFSIFQRDPSLVFGGGILTNCSIETKELEMKNEEQGFTVNGHFDGKEMVVRQIYDELLKILRNRGPIVEEPHKASIHLLRTTTLAGIATRKDYLVLTIKSDRMLTSPRIGKTEKISAHRYHLKLKLKSPLDINEELVGWLNHAYMLSAKN
jgi:Domain of unknown function (DUF5655)